jgi:DNA-binding NarL/FixJ family response regulator
MKVFLVEDSPMLRERVEAILASIPGAESAGQAAGAEEAIAAIERARPDAVVLDIQLEQGSGFDVLRALRKSLPATRVYVLTNFADDAYRRKAEILGARGFFDKSTEFERLREALVGIAQGRS